MQLNLHIERLILDMDIPPRQRSLLKTTVEAELVRLLLEKGLPPKIQDSAPIEGLSLTLNQQQDDSTQMGHQIAQSIYGQLISSENSIP